MKYGVCISIALLAVIPLSSLQGTERTNFIIIMADDLGYGDLGCYGNRHIRTPHLNLMASQGMKLSNFHSSGAVCSPTRAGLVTGRYQQRANIPTVIFADPQRPTHPHGLQHQETTFAEILSSAGYQTALFGKWHLGYYNKYNPVNHGFGEFRGYISGNVDFFSHIDQAGRLDWWHNTRLENESGYTTHLITKHSLSFINKNKQKPFCLYIAYEPPHYPYQGPQDKPIRTLGKPRDKKETRQSQSEITRAYRQMIEEMDKGIGQIFGLLKNSKLEENTLVLFFSDNGATRHGSNGPLRGHKGQLWEGGHRVPCLAWWKGKIKPGSHSDNLTISLDILPTILAAANCTPPENLVLDGVNLIPLLTEGRSLPSRKLFWGHGKSRALIEDNWKLVMNARGQTEPGLYHLKTDLSEQHNVASKHPNRLKQMLKAIHKWEQDVSTHATPQPVSPPK